MKNLAGIVLITFSLVSCGNSASESASATKIAQVDPILIAEPCPEIVQVVEKTAGTGAGCYGQRGQLTIKVSVRNDAYHKKAGIRFAVNEGDAWQNQNLTYKGPLSDTCEQWELSQTIASHVNTITFAAYYTAFYEDLGESKTYWDNNREHNYTLSFP